MTTLDYLQAQACTVAWNAAHSHGLNAMVAVLHALRNQAASEGEWSPTINRNLLATWCAAIQTPLPVLPGVRDPDFKNLLERIAPKIITDLSQPLARTVDRHHYLNFSDQPPASGGALTIGNLYFF